MPTTVTRTVGDVVTMIEIPDSVDPMKALEIIEERFLAKVPRDVERDKRYDQVLERRRARLEAVTQEDEKPERGEAIRSKPAAGRRQKAQPTGSLL